MHDIILSRDDANSESALLVEWLADDRATVAKGEVVCVIETSKSSIEIEAPGDGTLWRFARAGEEVAVGARIAAVAVDSAELAELEQGPREERPKPAALSSAKVTRKALELAELHGIDVDALSADGPGFVTADDVLAAVAQRDAAAAGDVVPLPGWLADLSLEGVSLPDALGVDDAVGVLDPAFLAALRADPDAIRALPAEARLELYRSNGASIGKRVRLGTGTIIDSPRIILGDGATIGDACTITADEVVSVGALTKFGDRLRLNCRRVFIGIDGYICDDVHIGGGGSHDPQAGIVIGDLAFVGDEAFINPCRPVVIGREVFVTMRSVLVTHNVGHSLVEGFENRFAPIVLEDRAQVGIGTVIYAGCRVGAGSIVASNSYVVANVPPGKLAIGVPARVAGAAQRTLSGAQQAELATRMVAELQALLELRGHPVEPIPGGFSVVADGVMSQVLFSERLEPSFAAPGVDGETVVLTLVVEGAPPDGLAVLDLLGRRVHGSGGVVLESVREFCRKRGIRFLPGLWRYRGGLV